VETTHFLELCFCDLAILETASFKWVWLMNALLTAISIVSAAFTKANMNSPEALRKAYRHRTSVFCMMLTKN